MYFFYIILVFLHALRQIITVIRITIEDRVLKGFMKYSKKKRTRFATFARNIVDNLCLLAL